MQEQALGEVVLVVNSGAGRRSNPTPTPQRDGDDDTGNTQVQAPLIQIADYPC